MKSSHLLATMFYRHVQKSQKFSDPYTNKCAFLAENHPKTFVFPKKITYEVPQPIKK